MLKVIEYGGFAKTAFSASFGETGILSEPLETTSAQRFSISTNIPDPVAAGDIPVQDADALGRRQNLDDLQHTIHGLTDGQLPPGMHALLQGAPRNQLHRNHGRSAGAFASSWQGGWDATAFLPCQPST